MKKSLLVFASFLTIALASAQTVGDPFTVDNISYKVTKLAPNEAEVTGSTLATVVVPSAAVDPANATSYSITAIGASAFQNNITITSIELPVTVKNIGTSAFQSLATATSLTAVTFTTVSGITNVGQRAFLYCSSLTNIDGIMSALVTLTGTGIFNGVGISTLTTPSTLTDFASTVTSTFRATTVSSADLSASTLVTLLPNLTFLSNPNLASVLLPSSLTTIGTSVFSGCPSLTSIVLPANVTSIGSKAFENCTALTSVQLNNATPITITADVFSGTMIIANATLHVPLGTTGAYSTALVWKDFGVITDGVTTLSTSNLEQALGFSFYPNPTNGIVSIKSKQLNNASVGVYDLNGRALLNQTITGTSSEINISNLASGIYLFKVQVEDAAFTKRIVKQ